VLTINAIEFDHAWEALQHINADPRWDTAIILRGKHYATHKADAEKLEMARVEFAYLHDVEMPDGSWRIMTIPVN
jgi:hypothetical protein